MITIKVDELSLSAIDDDTKPESWPDVAVALIADLGDYAGLIDPLGEPTPAPPLTGYTTGLDFGLHSFLCRASFHETKPSMGVALRVSAQALDYWRFATKWHVRTMLQGALGMDDARARARVRVTRIDLAADFIGEGLSVDEVAHSIDQGAVAFYKMQKDGLLREISQGRRTLGENDEVQTLYMGSRKKNSKWLARLYNKAAEQKAQKGPHLAFALKHPDWSRLELELRHNYADQVGHFLARCPDDAIADAATGRYLNLGCQCWNVDGDGKPLKEQSWSAALAQGELVPPLSSDYRSLLDLENAYAYHATDSGLMSLLYRAEGVWGADAPRAMMEALLAEQHLADPTVSTVQWLKKNAGDYASCYSNVQEMLEEGAKRAEARRQHV
ncbi:replication initiation factor domain-containing protein [Atopobiaceae bacterium FL090493]|nr:replication initiation factor domain-containing protein [Atopobiaceae bacterium FL090493]